MNYSLLTDSQLNAETSLRMRGRLTHRDFNSFLDVTERMLDLGAKRLVFDMEELEFIDSSGVGMLLMALNLARQNCIDVALRNPKGQAMRVIEQKRLDELFCLV